jgi:hypothetical protein
METIKHPLVLALLTGGVVFIVMSYVNTCEQVKSNKKDKKDKNGKQTKSRLNFLGDPKEANILIACIASLAMWYYAYSYMGTGDSKQNLESKPELVGGNNSSEARRSYNLIGSGLKLPTKVLPCDFELF